MSTESVKMKIEGGLAASAHDGLAAPRSVIRGLNADHVLTTDTDTLSRFSRFFLSLPQEEMRRRARLLDVITRIIALVIGGLGTIGYFFLGSRTPSADSIFNLLILAIFAFTALLTFFALRLSKYQMATLFFVVGFTMTVSSALWQFGQRIPEVHLAYLLPIALAATLWGSVPGSLTALSIWGINVWIVANQPGSSPLPYSLTESIGLLTLGATYLALALVVGRYAEGLVEALGRAEQKAEQAASAEAKALRFFEELEDAYVQTVLALAKAVEAKDTYTADHADRLALQAELVARKLGISDAAEIQALRFGAMLHDVGKIGVPDSILKKPGRLTLEEWKLMRQHPVIGSRILETVARLRQAAKIVRHHHERWDGQGYPAGLKGEAIPLGARILTVVDSYSAIVDERVYKAARTHAEAVAELTTNAGTQFDPHVVEVFLETCEEENCLLVKKSKSTNIDSTQSRPSATTFEIETLNRVMGAVSGSLDLDEVLRQAARISVETLGAAASGIFVYDEESDTLTLAANFGLPDSLKERFARFHVAGFHNESVVRQACARLYEDLAQVPAFVELGLPEAHPDWGAYLCVPLTAKGKVNGVMGLFSHRPHTFDRHDLALYQSMGEQIGQAIANARLHDSVQQLAITDSLTGAYNRRYLFDFLTREIDRGRRYPRNLSLIMLDVDEFKSYNDTYGHPAGDQVLRELVRVLQDNLRAMDVIARYGGDEFVIVLPDAEMQGARAAAEKIRAAVDAYCFPQAHLTISQGIASCPLPTDTTPEALMAMADRAVYDAKHLGRNSILPPEGKLALEHAR